MHIFHDPNSGEIAALYNGPTDDIVSAKAAQGLAYIEADWPDEAEREDYLVQGDALVQKPAPGEAEILEAARSAAISELITTTQYFIRHKPDGRIRYDEDLKLNLLWAAVNADKAGEPRPEPSTVVASWIDTVQLVYKQKFDALAAAADLAAVQAVDISYQWFEDRYGVSGTVLADPDKSTQDLMSQA